MRAHQVFAAMSPEEATRVLDALLERAPGVYTQSLAAASVAFKARPQFLMKQPPAKRAAMVRRALARVAANDLAEEVLANYFLDVRKELLVEWLDAVGVEHEEGVLQGDMPPSPPEETLRKAVEVFLRGGKDAEGEEGLDRALLLRAFAAQRAVDWPALESLLPPASGAR